MNVRPGDFAIVVGCWDGRFNGATCEVLSAGHDDLLSAFGAPYWLVRFGRAMPWNVRGGENGCSGDFPDMWLRKIGGPDIAESVLRDRLREVVA